MIIKNKNLAMTILFVLTILIGIGGNFIKGSADDPSDDGAYYYDVAENLEEGRGFQSDIKQYWLDDWRETEEPGVIENPYIGVVLFPLYSSIVLRFDDSLMAIRIANTVVSGITIVLMFTLVSKLFNEKIAFLSSLIFIFNPLFFIFYTSILSEALFLMIYLVPFLVLVRKEIAKISTTDLILCGGFSALAFLSRMVGLLVIVSIFIWLIGNRKFRKGSIYGISTFTFLLPWLVWNKTRVGYFFPFLHIAAADRWPVVMEDVTHGNSSTNITHFARDLLAFTTDLTSIHLFFILVPFILIGILKFIKDKNISLIIIFSLITVLFHILTNYSLRYMAPIIPLMIPIGLKMLWTTIEKIDVRTILNVNISGKMVFASLIIFIIFVQSLAIANIINDSRDSISGNHNSEKYEYLTEISSKDAIICSTEPRHAHYFTERQTIILATNLNETDLDNYIDFYEISFIVLEDISIEKYEDNSFLYSLYEANDTYELGEYVLRLFHEEPGYGNDMIFYRVERS